MATTVPIDIDAVFLATTETTVGTVPVSKEWNIATIRFCNIDTVDHQLTVYNGTGAGDDQHAEFKDLTVQAKTTFEFGPVILPASRKISALADTANKINARIHGWETTP